MRWAAVVLSAVALLASKVAQADDIPDFPPGGEAASWLGDPLTIGVAVLVLAAIGIFVFRKRR